VPQSEAPTFDGPPAHGEPMPYVDPTLFGAVDADDPLPLFAYDTQNPLDPEKVELLALYKLNMAREPEQVDEIENVRITDIELRRTIMERGYGEGVYIVNARAFRNHRIIRWGKAFRVKFPPKMPAMRSGQVQTGGSNGHPTSSTQAYTLDAKNEIVIPGSSDPMQATLIWMQQQEAKRSEELRQQREEMKADRERMETRHREQLTFLENRMVQQVKDVQTHANSIMASNGRPINEDVMENIREQRDRFEKEAEASKREVERLKEERAKSEREAFQKQLDKSEKEIGRLRQEVENAPEAGDDSEPTLAGAVKDVLPMVLPGIMEKLGLKMPTEGTAAVPETG
jgi:hypothetical protein